MRECYFFSDAWILFEIFLLKILRWIENNVLVLLLWFWREHSDSFVKLVFAALKALTSWISLRFALVRVIRFDWCGYSGFWSLFVTCSPFLRADSALSTYSLNRFVVQIDLSPNILELFNLFVIRNKVYLLLNGWPSLLTVFLILHLHN